MRRGLPESSYQRLATLDAEPDRSRRRCDALPFAPSRFPCCTSCSRLTALVDARCPFHRSRSSRVMLYLCIDRQSINKKRLVFFSHALSHALTHTHTLTHAILSSNRPTACSSSQVDQCVCVAKRMGFVVSVVRGEALWLGPFRVAHATFFVDGLTREKLETPKQVLDFLSRFLRSGGFARRQIQQRAFAKGERAVFLLADSSRHCRPPTNHTAQARNGAIVRLLFKGECDGNAVQSHDLPKAI